MIGVKEKLFEAASISHNVLRHIVQWTVTFVHVFNLQENGYQSQEHPFKAFACFLKLLCFQALVFSKFSCTQLPPYCKFYPCWLNSSTLALCLQLETISYDQNLCFLSAFTDLPERCVSKFWRFYASSIKMHLGWFRSVHRLQFQKREKSWWRNIEEYPPVDCSPWRGVCTWTCWRRRRVLSSSCYRPTLIITTSSLVCLLVCLSVCLSVCLFSGANVYWNLNTVASLHHSLPANAAAKFHLK